MLVTTITIQKPLEWLGQQQQRPRIAEINMLKCFLTSSFSSFIYTVSFPIPEHVTFFIHIHTNSHFICGFEWEYGMWECECLRAHFCNGTAFTLIHNFFLFLKFVVICSSFLVMFFFWLLAVYDNTHLIWTRSDKISSIYNNK